MKTQKTWILIADGARARLVESQGVGAALTPVGNATFGASHAPSRDFGTDKPGRTHDRSGTRQTAKEPRTDWHTFEKERFATDMAHVLDVEAERNAFDRLVLVAPPKTLGVLRKELGAGALKRVVAEVGKDLTHLPDRELAPHLAAEIRL